MCMHATSSVHLVPVYHYCSHVTLSHSFSLMPYPAFQSVAAVRLTPQRSPSSGFPTTTVRVSLARDVSTRLGAFQPAVARCNHAANTLSTQCTGYPGICRPKFDSRYFASHSSGIQSVFSGMLFLQTKASGA